MKKLRFIFLSLTMILLIVLVGCSENKDHVSIRVNGINTDVKDEENTKINNEVNTDEIKEVNNQVNTDVIHPNRESLTYQVKDADWLKIRGFKRIDTYAEYREYFTDLSKNNYDEVYFESSGLILYGTWEGSGSIFVELTSLELDDNNQLIVNVSKRYPSLGTCDMAYHGFIVEYQKLAEPIDGLSVTYTITNEVNKEFTLRGEESRNNINQFLNEFKDNLMRVSSMIWFKDDIDPRTMIRDEVKAHYKTVNNEKVVEYEIDQLIGSIYVSDYSPIVQVSFTSFNDTELNKLYNISLIENMGTVYINFIYEETTVNNEKL